MTTQTYDATVTNIEDPERRGRIQVACVGLMGDEDSTLPNWIEPVLQWGWFLVPDVGEMVEIECEISSSEDEIFGQTSLDSPDMRWKGKRHWTSDNVEDQIERREIPEDFKTNYGKRRGFATPNGHIFYFDDTTGQEKVQMTWKQNDKYQFISMDEKGAMIIKNASGTIIYMNPDEKSFSIVDENGNVIGTSPDGIKLVDKFSNIIELKDGVIQILGQSSVTINAGVCDIKAATVNILDGAKESIPLGDSLKAHIDAITVPTGMGPSGTPTDKVPATALSKNAKVGP